MMRDILRELNLTRLQANSTFVLNLIEEHKAEITFVHKIENILLITFDVITFTLGLFFNSVVIITFVKHKQAFLTVTNCFLLNLTIADLLVTLICIPAALIKAVTDDWMFGLVACKAVPYLEAVAVSNSVFTLTVMGVDRYFAVCRPLERKNLESKKAALLIIFALWIFAILLFIPMWFTLKLTGYFISTARFEFCIEDWPSKSSQRLIGTLWFTLVYVIPTIINGVAYSKIIRTLRQSTLFPELRAHSRADSSKSPDSSQGCFDASRNIIKERRKISKLVMIITTVFIFCWLPANLYNLGVDLKAVKSTDNKNTSSNENDEDDDSRFEEMLNQYFVLLGHLTTFLNPLFYSLQTRNFRNHVKSWLGGLCCCCKKCEKIERISEAVEMQPTTEMQEEPVFLEG